MHSETTPDATASGPAGHDMNWHDVYGGEQVWSGNPNDALVAVLTKQLADLSPGRALDVGCGEGADAIHLAERGWQVTALDVAAPALERGRAAAEKRGDDVASRITWVCAGLLDAALAPESFDLVSVFYPALLRTEDQSIERSLRDLVRPCGALIVWPTRTSIAIARSSTASTRTPTSRSPTWSPASVRGGRSSLYLIHI